MASDHVIETEVLVIGGGIAGGIAAIKAREQGRDVLIVDKAYAGKSGASISPPAGMACWNPEWGVPFEVITEALNADGEYVNNREWCEIITKESWEIHQDLAAWGVPFGPYTPEMAKMICPPHTNVPIPFRGITPPIRKQAAKVGVKFMDRIMVTDLLVQDGQVAGAAGFSIDSGDFYVFRAKATVLTGGGNSFKPWGFPIHMLTGDAEAMAYRAGAEMASKEFSCTTHPTRAAHPAALFAMKHVGPVPFMNHFDASGEEVHWSGAPVHTEPDLGLEFVVHAGRTPLYSDLDRMPEEQKQLMALRFPASPIYGKVQLAGGSAVGYGNVGTGGIWVTDTKCSTSLPGLYTAGDCAGSRHNGALIVNVGGGTTPTAVTGKRAGLAAAEYAAGAKSRGPSKDGVADIKRNLYASLERKEGYGPRWVTQLLQNTMTPYFVSYIKHGARLQAALTNIEFLRDHLVPQMYARDVHELKLVRETRNMVLTAEMILRASLFRTESRGAHYREDYPRRDDPAWLAWTQLKEENGAMKVVKVPIPKEWWPDLSKPYAERYPKRFPGESVEG
jgi:succinate dehydrogenase/fumarate reductase flavoprotein subunit